MRLTAIELENFKGIGPRQRIELKPITLLFGPNSAGKSTILQALHYVREILERGDCSPDITIAGVDLKGFSQFVHRHDLELSISLRLEFDLEEDELPRYAALSGDERDEFEVALSSDRFHSLSEAASASVEFTIRWSKQRNTAYVSALTVGLNNRDIATITASSDGKRVELDRLDAQHPLVNAANPDSELERSNGLESVFPILKQPEADVASTAAPGPIAPVALAGLVDAVPRATVLLPLDIDHLFDVWWQVFLDTGDVEETEKPSLIRGFRYEFRAAHAYVSRAIVGPIDALRGFLAKTIHIGPLRRVPSRNFRPAKGDRPDRWMDGSAAWDQLFRADDPELLQLVNRWLADEGGLETGYQLGLTRTWEEYLGTADTLEEAENSPSGVFGRRLRLIDTRSGVEVGFIDIGVGISQILPVIVALVRPSATLVAIEQPELHIHPALQVKLGDLLIAGTRPFSALLSTSPTCLIETHSEHIMLRLLRRIRETYDDELSPDQPRLSAEAVGVVYVQPSDEGAQFLPLRISPEGNFIDQWPKGFFDERVDELF